jgi:hypothetical protein
LRGAASFGLRNVARNNVASSVRSVFESSLRVAKERAGMSSALVIAHPGHELRLHGWLERERPIVFVLTDGSGRLGRPRLASTTRVLTATGARPGPIYGRFTDRATYDILLGRRTELVVALVTELADAFRAAAVERVVTDGFEGLHPVHDLAVAVAAAAAVTAGRHGARPIATFHFPLDGRPDARPLASDGEPLRMTLDDPALVRKAEAARAYAALAPDVGHQLDSYGLDAFRHELVWPLAGDATHGGPPVRPPYYESFGEQQVLAGYFERVVRYEEHWAPLVRELWDRVVPVDACVPCAS